MGDASIMDLPAGDRGSRRLASAESAMLQNISALMYRELDDRIPLWADSQRTVVRRDEGYRRSRHAPGRRDLAKPRPCRKIF